MIKRQLKKILAWFGINIIRIERTKGNILKNRLSRHRHIGFQHEDEAFGAVQIVSSNTMLPYEPLVTLYEQVIYCEQNNIAGDFVECGTWKGGATGMMAIANLKHGYKRRHLHLFDAFTEICQPDETHDDKKLVAEVKKIANIHSFDNKLQPLKGVYDQFGGPGTLEENKFLLEKKILYPSGCLHYHIGWFQDTVPRDASQIAEIALLRLDGDWYESTKVCLEHLYPKVPKGGVIVIDDYGYNIGCKKAVDEFLKQQMHYPILNYINNSCRYFIKPS